MLIHADARYLPLRDGCVQVVVTSPPYFGLRDYGTARWVGGDDECDHRTVSDVVAAVPISRGPLKYIFTALDPSYETKYSRQTFRELTFFRS